MLKLNIRMLKTNGIPLERKHFPILFSLSLREILAVPFLFGHPIYASHFRYPILHPHGKQIIMEGEDIMIEENTVYENWLAEGKLELPPGTIGIAVESEMRVMELIFPGPPHGLIYMPIGLKWGGHSYPGVPASLPEYMEERT